jgi:probable HAF family extracellular repeat protein
LILLAIIASMAAPVHAGELTINYNSQVVGFSRDQYGNNTVAWIWQNGTMTDLNTLIPPSSPEFFIEVLGSMTAGKSRATLTTR